MEELMSQEQSDVDESNVVAALSDGAYTLVVADFSDTDTAWRAYEGLKSVEDGRSVEIEGVLVVKRGADGTLEVQKATDHSTKHGLRWGLRSRSFQNPGSCLLPWCRRDPQGARHGRRDRRAGNRQGRGGGHEGRGEGGRSKSRGR